MVSDFHHSNPNSPYIEAIGKGTAQLRVNYEQQAEMPLEDKQEPTDAAAPLAPAAVMGGTHQKRKPRENKSTVN